MSRKKKVVEPVVERTTKEKFVDLIKERGFTSINSFGKACGVDTPNIYTNMNGKFKLSVDRAFVYANTLGVPVSDVLEVFYSEKFKENEEIVRNYKIPVAN